jgi:hypothetical protein
MTAIHSNHNVQTFGDLLRRIVLPIMLGWFLAFPPTAWADRDDGPPASDSAQQLFEIRVLDVSTLRGIPLIELITVDDVMHVTDNAGRIAYHESDHFGQEIFFRINAPGYELKPDGYGQIGVRLKIERGKRAEIRLPRINLAERMYRCTGQGRYRDTLALKLKVPPDSNGQVAGQDSVQVVHYKEKLYWFWGDTNRLLYPLGLFRTAGATSPLPSPTAGHDEPMEYNYFVDDAGFARAMIEHKNPQGVIWIDGVTTVPDGVGPTKLVARFSRRKGLEAALEQGMATYNDAREIFEPSSKLPLSETWRFLREHPVQIDEPDGKYIACGNPFPLTRVPATYADVINPEKYESFGCTAIDEDPATAKPLRDASGKLQWTWRNGPPTTQAEESRWLKAGLIKPDEARYLPRDVATGDVIEIHGGTVYWNAYRQRWLMIAVEHSWNPKSPSFLGEVWYSESLSPQGPFAKAVKILTHQKQSFYNPCHHPFMDQENGRVIFFEGTYCNTFTNSPPTPRYNYNQMMYRLELDRVAEKL